MDERRSLPVVDAPAEAAEGACGPKIYVTHEESALLAVMRRVHGEAVEVRRELAGAAGDATRERLEGRLAELRDEWRALAARREQAYRRKMVMLGHMDPA